VCWLLTILTAAAADGDDSSKENGRDRVELVVQAAP
jgi:hypothetical protein